MITVLLQQQDTQQLSKFQSAPKTIYIIKGYLTKELQ